MRQFAASDLILHCLPMSHIKDARLIWIKSAFSIRVENSVDSDQMASSEAN